ncbi:MAG: hypothetical protein LBJ97_02295 [Mycoplasmataceae bacterium]|nr:hypothetical protein [Mycoplasmataceae bacterium]
METRIERYRIYRNEIINEGVLLDRLVDETNISRKYKSKIDNLDSSILANLNFDKSLAKLISVDENEMKESKQMMHFMELIDDKKIKNIATEIAEWNNKCQSQPIIDHKGNINSKWLIEDPTYSSFKDNEKKIEIQNSNWTNFQTTSLNQISKINELSQLTDNANAVEKLKSIVVYNDQKRNYNKIIYIVPSVLSIVSLLGIISLLVVIITRL